MQSFILWWITSIIVSFWMKIILIFKIVKDIADEGCTLNLDNLDKQVKENKSYYEYQNKQNKLELLVPFYNIYNQLKLTASYINNTGHFLQYLDMDGDIRKMSEWENIEYSKNPTILNAFFLPIKSELQLAKSVKLPLNRGEGELWFSLNEETEEIIIVKSDGNISKYTTEHQKRMIIHKLGHVSNEDFHKYVFYLEEDLQEIIDDRLKNLDNCKSDKNQSKKTITDKIEELKKLKEEYTEVENNEIDYNKTQSKKKKK